MPQHSDKWQASVLALDSGADVILDGAVITKAVDGGYTSLESKDLNVGDVVEVWAGNVDKRNPPIYSDVYMVVTHGGSG
jgi:hypothetical protein